MSRKGTSSLRPELHSSEAIHALTEENLALVEEEVQEEQSETGEEDEEAEEWTGDEEEEGEDEEEDQGNKGDLDRPEKKSQPEKPKIVKPIVIVRVKPSKTQDDSFHIGENRTTLQVMVNPEDRYVAKKKGESFCFSFETDGIFVGANQDEFYYYGMRDIVDNAMQGVSSVVVSLGAESSGKSFTLFGSDNFQQRGIIPRTVEDIFSKLEFRNKKDYHVILSMFCIRKDKIRDLVTLTPNDLNVVGNFGPKGLFFEEVLSVDHALGLLFRGLAGLRHIPTDSFAKYHTIVYIDILANVNSKSHEAWRSRITFAKIASMPSKHTLESPAPAPGSFRHTKSPFSLFRSRCPDGSLVGSDGCVGVDGVPRRYCGGPNGRLQEMINVRKDMYLLEQMLTNSYDIRKINEFYAELQKVGVFFPNRHPVGSPTVYFRQSKLAHCLKDIVSGTALVRVILHIRPEKPYILPTLEVMRFAERARGISCEIYRQNTSCTTMANKTTQMDDDAASIDALDEQSNLIKEKMKEAFQTATNYFEEKVDLLDGNCREQMKGLCNNFKEIWENMLKSPAPGQKSPSMFIPNHEGHSPSHEDLASMEEGAGEEFEDDESEIVSTKSRISESARTLKTAPSKTKRNSDEKEKKGKKKGKRGSGDSGKRKKGGEKEEEGGGEAKSKEKKKKQSTAQFALTEEEEMEDQDVDVPEDGRPVQQMSISAIPNDATDNAEVNAALAHIHFKCKCWEEFAGSPVGAPMVQELGERQALLKQYIAEHNETLKEVVNTLTKLVALELDLDKMEQDQANRDENLAKNMTAQKLEAAGRCQTELRKLQIQQKNINTIMALLESSKQDCDKAFDYFSGRTEVPPQPQHAPEGTLEQRYHGLWQAARNEAQSLVTKTYPKRPPWTSF